MAAFLGNLWPPDPEELQWDVQWLRARPVCAGAALPLALDLALLLSDTFPNESIFPRIASALIPTWEELQVAGISANEQLPGFHDLNALEHLSSKSSIIDWLVRIIADLGNRFGLYVFYRDRPDSQDLFLILKLAEQARASGLMLVLNAPVELIEPLPTNLFSLIEPSCSSSPKSEEPYSAAIKYLINSPHGLRRDELRQLGIDMGLDVPSYGTSHPVFVVDKKLTDERNSNQEREIHKQLYKLTKFDGYGYLTKCFHAANSKSLELLSQVHLPLLGAATHIALPQLARHYSAFAEALSRTNEASASYVYFNLGRIVQDMDRRAARYARPQLYFFRSYCRADRPEDKIEIIYYIANQYAKERSPKALQKASRWYAKGFRLLKRVEKNAKRNHCLIRLCNGFALIAYIRGENDKALELEERAMRVAVHSRSEDAAIYAWAFPLLSLNTAKLLTERYGRVHHAKQILTDVIAAGSKTSSEYATIELAKIEFDQQNYKVVIGLLAALCERNDWMPPDDVIEIYVRVLFTLSLAFTSDLARAQEQCDITLKAAKFSGTVQREMVEQIARYLDYCENASIKSHNNKV